jgi:hypothetical protein
MFGIGVVLLANWALAVAVASEDYQACLENQQCRTVYHQYPPNRAVFDHIVQQGTESPPGRVQALLARSVGLETCARNEKYVVYGEEGRCVCPSETAHCGRITPFHHTIVSITCVVGTIFLLGHMYFRSI